MATSRRLAAVLLIAAGAAQAGPARVPLERRFTPEQMHATGLDRLTPAQLAELDALLARDAAACAAPGSATRAAPTHVPVSARLVGRFTGWTAGTVLALDDGSRWRVTDGSYHAYPAVDAPRVTVRPGVAGAWYLRVEGQAAVAPVRRVD